MYPVQADPICSTRKEWNGLDTLVLSAGVSALQPLLSVAGLKGSGAGMADIEGLNRVRDVAAAAMRGNFTGPLLSAVTYVSSCLSDTPNTHSHRRMTDPLARANIEEPLDITRVFSCRRHPRPHAHPIRSLKIVLPHPLQSIIHRTSPNSLYNRSTRHRKPFPHNPSAIESYSP